MAIRKTKLRKWSYLLAVLIKRDIRNQYAGSILGVLWTVLNPLLNMIVMAIIFSQLFGSSDIKLDYAVYVLSGTIVFTLFRAASEGALTSIVDQRDLLSKTQVPLWIVPTSRVGASTVSFLFSYISLLIVMTIRIPAGVKFYSSMVMAFVMLPSLLLFSLGISLFLCCIYVFFRDIRHFYSVLLTLWMYLTPLFYSFTALNLSENFIGYLQLNPMYHYVLYFRETLMGIANDWKTLSICYCWGIGMFLLGFLFFEMKKNKLLVDA